MHFIHTIVLPVAFVVNLAFALVLRRLWRAQRIARDRVWWGAILLLAIAVLAGKLAFLRTTPSDSVRLYGFPVPYAAWERNDEGKWRDYISASPLEAILGNFGLFFGLLAPASLLILIRRRPKPTHTKRDSARTL